MILALYVVSIVTSILNMLNLNSIVCPPPLSLRHRKCTCKCCIFSYNAIFQRRYMYIAHVDCNYMYRLPAPSLVAPCSSMSRFSHNNHSFCSLLALEASGVGFVAVLEAAARAFRSCCLLLLWIMSCTSLGTLPSSRSRQCCLYCNRYHRQTIMLYT